MTRVFLAVVTILAALCACGPAAPAAEEPAPPAVVEPEPGPAAPTEPEWTGTAPEADLRIAGPNEVGGRARRDLREAMTAQEDRVRHCYELAERQGGSASGLVTVRMVVRPSGTVQSVELMENATGSAAFATCLLGVARRVVFPAAEDQGVTVIHAFGLQGGEDR